MTSRLAVVEDHGLIAEIVGTALRADGFEVEVVEVTPNEELAPRIRKHDPDLVLLDLDLGDGRDALEVLPGLEGTRVLMVTGVTDPVRLARCVRAGAVGIVDKGLAFDQLRAAVRHVLDHGTLLDRHEREEHLALLRRHEAEEQARRAPFEELTPREAEVLRALCRGQSVDQIAREAVVSVATVRTQVRAILRKLGVSSQLAATALARRAGWVE